jgi:hypothetical protein
MTAILRHDVPVKVAAILDLALMISFAHSETIEFSWMSEGAFHGTPSAGTVDTIFSSSAPFQLASFHSNYTGEGGATRVFGSFEITADSGDKLLGNFEIIGSGPIRLGTSIGSGTFMFTGGSGQFAGATGEGILDVTITLSSFPTTTGTVEHDWSGSITLPAVPLPGDYNGDGNVDAADYVVWRKTLGQTGAGLAADGNGDNQVGSDDYDLWRANFGAPIGSGSVSSEQVAVPEPTTFTLVLFAIACRVRRYKDSWRKVAWGYGSVFRAVSCQRGPCTAFAPPLPPLPIGKSDRTSLTRSTCLLCCQLAHDEQAVALSRATKVTPSLC